MSSFFTRVAEVYVGVCDWRVRERDGVMIREVGRGEAELVIVCSATNPG